MDMNNILDALIDAFAKGNQSYVAAMFLELAKDLRRQDVRIPDHTQEERDRLATMVESLWRDVQQGTSLENVGLVFQSAFKNCASKIQNRTKGRDMGRREISIFMDGGEA